MEQLSEDDDRVASNIGWSSLEGDELHVSKCLEDADTKLDEEDDSSSSNESDAL
jgi:hypothetical protein